MHSRARPALAAVTVSDLADAVDGGLHARRWPGAVRREWFFSRRVGAFWIASRLTESREGCGHGQQQRMRRPQPLGTLALRRRRAATGPAPPPAEQLRAELKRLSQRDWEHPSGGEPVRFSGSTIERWYYQARASHQDPIKALRARPRTDVRHVRAMSAALIAALREQHRTHPSWSAQLHHDNLQARVDTDPSLGPMPSYSHRAR